MKTIGLAIAAAVALGLALPAPAEASDVQPQTIQYTPIPAQWGPPPPGWGGGGWDRPPPRRDWDGGWDRPRPPPQRGMNCEGYARRAMQQAGAAREAGCGFGWHTNFGAYRDFCNNDPGGAARDLRQRQRVLDQCTYY